MDLRTKPSVEAGIVFKSESDGFTFVDYQPGNGTRYCVTLMSTDEFDPPVCERMGWESGSVVATLFSEKPYKSMMLAPTGFLHWSYVEEKLGVGESDAKVLAELFGYFLRREVVPCDEDSAK